MTTKLKPSEKVVEKRFIICSPLRRILSFFVDIFFLILFFRFVLFTLFTQSHWDIELNIEKNILFSSLLAFFLFLCKDLFGGRSLGKIFFAIVVRNVARDAVGNFSKPYRRHLFLRNIPLLLFPVELFFLLRDNYSRRLGDRWVGTFVLLDKEKTSKNNPIRWLTLRVLLFIFLLALLVSSYFILAPIQVKKSYAYQVAIEALEADISIQKEFGQIVSYGYWPEFYRKGNQFQINLSFKGQYFDGKAYISLDFNEKSHYFLKDLKIIKKNG